MSTRNSFGFDLGVGALCPIERIGTAGITDPVGVPKIFCWVGCVGADCEADIEGWPMRRLNPGGIFGVEERLVVRR